MMQGFESIDEELKSEFDNDNTMLYKLAAKEETTINYTVIEGDWYITLEMFLDAKAETIEDSKTFQAFSLSFENMEDIYHQIFKGKYEDILHYYEQCEDILMFYIKMKYEDRRKKLIEKKPEYKKKKLTLQESKKLNNEVLRSELPITNGIRLAVKEKYPNVRIEQLNIKKLTDNYNQWKREYKYQVKKTKEYATFVANDQETLNKETALYCENPVIEYTTHESSVFFRDTAIVPTIEEGIKIFDDCVVTLNIPYIQYNSHENKKYYKIFDNPKQNIIKTPSIYEDYVKKYSRIDTIYLIMVTEDRKVNKKNLIEVSYFIDTNKLTFISYNKTKKSGETTEPSDLHQYLNVSLPGLDLKDTKDSHISGYFDVHNLSVEASSFYYMLNTDTLLKMYLYIDESTKAWCNKNDVKIYYKAEEQNKKSPVIVWFDKFIPIVDEKKFETIQTKVRVKIFKAESMKQLTQFISVFSRLLARYMSVKSKIEAIMRRILGKQSARYNLTVDGFKVQASSSTIDSKTSNKKEKSKSQYKEDIVPNTPLKNLKAKASEFFSRKTGRKIQAGRQPTCIFSDEVEEWRQYTFTSTPRQVMPYPPILKEDGEYEDPLTIDPYDERVKYWFVCPDNKHQYPNLKNLKDGKDYLVLCGGKSTLDKKDSLYYKYHTKSAEASKGGKRVTHTNKLLLTGKLGTLSPILENLLNYDISLDEEKKEIRRYGTERSKNGLIHCILTATLNETYIMEKNSKKKEQIAVNVRTKIANTMSPLLFSQELFDLSEEEIKNELLDMDEPFASDRYYRGLEEMFQVNIFVFKPILENQKASNLVKDICIEIPRCKSFHIRPYREDRRSIFVYKHFGSESDNSAVAHYEVITHNKIEEKTRSKHELVKHGKTEETSRSGYENLENNDSISFDFGDEITRIVYLCLSQFSTCFILNIKDTTITTRVNTYSKVDWMEVFKKYTIVGQRTDQYGKMRVLGIQFNKTVITVYLPPSQPMNVPYLDELTKIENKLCIEIFGNPSGVVESKGLWYPAIDIQYCIFIPTIKDSELELLTPEEDNTVNDVEFNIEQFRLTDLNDQNTVEVPMEPINSDTNVIHDITEKLKLARKNIIYLTQLIRWLRRLEYTTDFDLWWSTNVVSNSRVTDEVKNDCKVGVRLPVVTNTLQGITSLYRLWGKFFFNKKINLYPALHDKLRLFFKHEEKLATRVEIKYLNRVYVHESDFVSRPNNLIFIDTQQVEYWIAKKSKNDSSILDQITISRQVENDKLFEIYPYIYLNPKNMKMYIIQAVKGGELKRVFNLCYEWNLHLINTGFYTDPIEEEYPHIFYSISSTNQLVPTENVNVTEDTDYFEIVKIKGVKQDRYFAMLPLNLERR